MRRRTKIQIVVDEKASRYGSRKPKYITKSRITPRPVKKDPIYDSELVTQLINRLMKNGKKELARRIVYDALKKVFLETREKNIVQVLEKAIENIKPELEVRTRRIGGQNYQIPVEVNKRRKQSLALRWLILAAREKKGRNMTEKLATEIVDASKGVGGAMKKREEIQKTAMANKAFSHFRW